MSHLYVLRCSSGKYYVGVSNNAEKDIAAHFRGEGECDWTKFYPPTAILVVRPTEGDENGTDKLIDLMGKHGLDNVRSSRYSNRILSKDRIYRLVHQARQLSKKCERCEGNHSSIDCPTHLHYQETIDNWPGKYKGDLLDEWETD